MMPLARKGLERASADGRTARLSILASIITRGLIMGLLLPATVAISPGCQWEVAEARSFPSTVPVRDAMRLTRIGDRYVLPWSMEPVSAEITVRESRGDVGVMSGSRIVAGKEAAVAPPGLAPELGAVVRPPAGDDVPDAVEAGGTDWYGDKLTDARAGIRYASAGGVSVKLDDAEGRRGRLCGCVLVATV
ncbi:hypothetical protein Vafri_164 [Volvox africanus]|nr:hypothetical protein Vafri_164 [Volvox africanus]